jgi:hypothetical protein
VDAPGQVGPAACWPASVVCPDVQKICELSKSRMHAAQGTSRRCLHQLTCRKRRLLQTEDPENDTLMNPDQFFFQLWEGVAELAGDVESPESLGQHYGQVPTLYHLAAVESRVCAPSRAGQMPDATLLDGQGSYVIQQVFLFGAAWYDCNSGLGCSAVQVLVLRAVVAQLQAELAPRLAAFRGSEGPGAAAKAAAGETGRPAAARRDALLRERRRLLEESHLWRLLAVRGCSVALESSIWRGA